MDYVKLLNSIKENIPKVEKSMENGNLADDNLLDQIKNDFMEIAIFMKNYLISKQEILIASILKNLDLIVDYQMPATCSIRLNPPAMLFNPLLIEDYSLKNIATDIMHNIYHLVFNHFAKIAKYKNSPDEIRKLNIAMDAEVNDIIYYDSRSRFKTTSGKEKLELHPDWITSDDIEKLSGITVKQKETYMYYANILDSQVENMKERMGQLNLSKVPGVKTDTKNNKQQEQNDNQSNDQQQSKPKNMSNKSKKYGDNIRTKYNIDDELEQHLYANKNRSSEEIETDTRGFVQYVYDNMSAKHRGNIPGNILEKIEILLQPPKLDWKKIFKRFIGTIPEGKRRTPYRLNRRQPTNPMVRGTLKDKVVDVIVAIDTSGSMTKEELTWAFNEIKGMLKGRRSTITVIECDSEINRIYDIKDKELKSIKEISGRGGTSFTPVIKYINDRNYRSIINEKVGYKRNRNFKNSLLVYITDGYGEHEIPRPNCHRTIWLLTGDTKNFSIKNTYGAPVVSLIDDEDFLRKFRF